jgi:hypothetical protein
MPAPLLSPGPVPPSMAEPESSKLSIVALFA